MWIGWSTPGGCSGTTQVRVSIYLGLWTGEKGSRLQTPTGCGLHSVLHREGRFRQVMYGSPSLECPLTLCVCSCTGCAQCNAEVRGLQVFVKFLNCLCLSFGDRVLLCPSWPRTHGILDLFPFTCLHQLSWPMSFQGLLPPHSPMLLSKL